ncbi:hypothetical protein GOODEAATRI_007984 [Goodea atripinnis]|uniref:Uncharacterized protein n=1 Tax=Goodea atripinnis TaxID=208336 RepID=A0ABV0MZQ5_9TELE
MLIQGTMPPNSQHSEGNLERTSRVISVCQAARAQAVIFRTLQILYYSCLRRASVISKYVCSGRAAPFANPPSLVKSSRAWVQILFRIAPKNHQRGCAHVYSILLLTGWTSQRWVHFVLTAGVSSGNGTLGRTGLICWSFQQERISETQI